MDKALKTQIIFNTILIVLLATICFILWLFLQFIKTDAYFCVSDPLAFYENVTGQVVMPMSTPFYPE